MTILFQKGALVQPTQPVEAPESSSPKEVIEEQTLPASEEIISNVPDEEKIPETTDEQRAETPHEESDYEDNITVTVPPAHLQSGEAFRDRHLNGRGRHMVSSGMDTSKHHHIHVVRIKKLNA